MMPAGNRQHPGPDDPRRHAPAHRRQPLRRADAHDRAGDRVRRRDRDARGRSWRRASAAPAVSAQNPPTGLSLVIFEPIVLTIRQPPTSVPERDRRVAGEHDPECDVDVGRRLADRLLVREDQDRDDPHRLLRVVAAVAEAVEAGRDELQLAEAACRRAPASRCGRATATPVISSKPEHQADHRRDEHRDERSWSSRCRRSRRTRPWRSRRRRSRRSARARSWWAARSTR